MKTDKKEWRKDEVDVRLIVAERGFRSSALTILQNLGFRNVTQGTFFEDVIATLKEYSPDLLIVSAEFPDGNIATLIRQLRNGDIGRNPFLPVVMLTGEATQKVVGGVVNSGADDLLIQPFSTQQFDQRLGILIENRKPFVVTSDYIGPDRRSSKRRDEGEEIPLLEVPNSLQSKVTGAMRTSEFHEAVKAAQSTINLQRLDRYGEQIAWLCARIIPGLERAEGQEELELEIVEFIDRLVEVAIDTGLRMVGTKYEHVHFLTDALADLARNIQVNQADTTKKDRDLLAELSRGVHGAFKDVDSASVAQQIGATLGKKAKQGT